MTYKPGMVVSVPFPFVDSAQTKQRPALVLSAEKFNSDQGQTVLAMITSAVHARWPSDVPIAALAKAGLTRPSVVRFKIFTLDNRLIAGVIGALSAKDWKSVKHALVAIMPIEV